MSHPDALDERQKAAYEQYGSDIIRSIRVIRRRVGENARIATLGPWGSNSSMIARRLVGDSQELATELHADFAGVLGSVLRSDAKIGILPLSNRAGGVARYANDSARSTQSVIEDKRLEILATVRMPIEHCLAAKSGIDDLATLEGRTVYSHPQALKQCGRYVDTHGLLPVSADSTSAAAKELGEGRLKPDGLVIASRWAADLYGLQVIQERINDLPTAENITTLAIVTNNFQGEL